MINVILSGGSGTRLWPLSRTKYPKQFIEIFNGRSTFQKTLERNKSICSKFVIVSNAEQFLLASEQAKKIGCDNLNFIIEPIGRNTAPAIALACMLVNKDDILLVSTSDHLIKKQNSYEKAVAKAKLLANENYLVTFGIQPSYPNTGFGYIQAEGNNVKFFTEKPSLEVAKSYINQGNYYWNSGMFCFKSGIFLSELKQHAPNIYYACQKALNSKDQQEYNKKRKISITSKAMHAIPENSIDYAVIEKSNKVKMIDCDIGWSDLGSFDTFYSEVKQESNDNAIIQSHVKSPAPITLNSSNNLVVSDKRQISLIDINNLLVVDTSDALLISKKGSSQKVKSVVSKIKQSSPELTEIHQLVYRPWGSYEVLVDTKFYKVKHILVNPKCSLSLQKHFHRNEHWVVVSGIASVIVEDKNFLLHPNESTYIKMGQVHRLANNGQVDLEMIEVQVGEYTGEDDIIRIDDIYDR